MYYLFYLVVNGILYLIAVSRGMLYLTAVSSGMVYLTAVVQFICVAKCCTIPNIEYLNNHGTAPVYKVMMSEGLVWK